MTDRKVPHISKNKRHGEDNAKSSYVPPPRSSTLITRPPCLLHVEVLEDPEGGSHGLPPPHQTSEIFYCWSDNILATTRSHITPQMADLAEGSGE